MGICCYTMYWNLRKSYNSSIFYRELSYVDPIRKQICIYISLYLSIYLTVRRLQEWQAGPLCILRMVAISLATPRVDLRQAINLHHEIAKATLELPRHCPGISAMQTPAKLCEYCRKIPFDAFGCPTGSELLHKLKTRASSQRSNRRDPETNELILYTSRMPYRNGRHLAYPEDLCLGALSRLLEEAPWCVTCNLFAKAIRRRWPGRIEEVADGLTIYLGLASTRDFANLTSSPRDGTGEGTGDDAYFLLRRICLFLRASDGSGADFAMLNIAQACNASQIVQDACHSNPSPMARMYFGGRLRPLVVDVRRLKSWIKICNSELHRETCRQPKQRDYGRDTIIRSTMEKCRLIRVIDVEQRCLRCFEEVTLSELKYVALSYVWGKTQKLLLLKENLPDFQQKNTHLLDKASRTIREFMELARLLKIQFVWIDALCIVQDDEADQAYQIGNMANIYKRAYVTVIAASGTDCESGLAGLSPGSRTYQQDAAIIRPAAGDDLGFALLNTCHDDLYDHLRDHQERNSGVEPTETSVWGTRGWTFQERILSSRSLVFTKEQVYWICEGGLFCEESDFEHPQLSDLDAQIPVSNLPLRVELSRLGLGALSFKSLEGLSSLSNAAAYRFWTKYQEVVETYTGRKLSHDGDIYDAFCAITDLLKDVALEQLHWGHPRSRFEMALMWDTNRTLVRRTNKTTLPMTSKNINVQIPSWSWMGWVGVVTNVSVSVETTDMYAPEFRSFSKGQVPLLAKTLLQYCCTEKD